MLTIVGVMGFVNNFKMFSRGVGSEIPFLSYVEICDVIQNRNTSLK